MSGHFRCESQTAAAGLPIAGVPLPVHQECRRLRVSAAELCWYGQIHEKWRQHRLFRSLIWDTTIPDVIRGRMAGLELLSYSVGPQVGQVRSTMTARYTSAQASLVIGGSVCAASIAGMAPALRELWSFDARTAGQQNAETTTVTR